MDLYARLLIEKQAEVDLGWAVRHTGRTNSLYQPRIRPPYAEVVLMRESATPRA